MKIGFYVPAREHLSVELLSAVLKQAGHTTEVFFDPRLCTDGALRNPLLASWLNEEDMLVDDILNAGLDLLCFSIVTDTDAIALRVADKVKRRSSIPTVFGGVHCTSVPERVAVKPQVDYVVAGEGEYALVELCEAIASGRIGLPSLHAVLDARPKARGAAEFPARAIPKYLGTAGRRPQILIWG